MYQASETINEQLRDKWLSEFSNNALQVLVDNAMSECLLVDTNLDGPKFNLRLALGATFKALVSEDVRIEWAHRIDPSVLDWDEFEERERDLC